MSNPFENLTQGVFPALQTRPFADDSTQAFWDAAKEDRLVVPQCTNCGTFRLPPSPYCFSCQQRGVEWVELPGTGTIYSRIIVRHPLHPDLADACPYVSGVVELDGTQGAGARMIANIVECDPETVGIGERVEIVFEHINDEMSVFRFRPIQD